MCSTLYKPIQNSHHKMYPTANFSVRLFIYLFKILNKIVTEIYKVSGKVQNKETLRIKTHMRGKQQKFIFQTSPNYTVSI